MRRMRASAWAGFWQQNHQRPLACLYEVEPDIAEVGVSVRYLCLMLDSLCQAVLLTLLIQVQPIICSIRVPPVP